MTADHPLPWLAGTLQTADACLLVVDLADPDCLQHVATVQEELARRKTSLVTGWPGDALPDVAGDPTRAADEDVFALRLPTLLLANKADLLAHAETDLEVLAELEEPHFPVLLVSARTGLGLGDLGAWLWRRLGLVRVYTKAPGKLAERDRPFTLRAGEQTVADAARLVHRDMERTLKYARVWGRSVTADGQHVGREHRLADGDVLELHA
jgi:ribosome-binding ATPase YchF (GTP1/OBG family)